MPLKAEDLLRWAGRGSNSKVYGLQHTGLATRVRSDENGQRLQSDVQMPEVFEVTDLD